MICTTQTQALKRVLELAVLAVDSTPVMREIIKLEMRDHIREWDITREQIQALRDLQNHRQAQQNRLH